VTATAHLTELAWQQLEDGDESVVGVIGGALQRSGALLLRDCPVQRSTPPSTLYALAAELFHLPSNVLLRYIATDRKNESGYMPGSGEWMSLALPEIWHVLGEPDDASRGRRRPNVWPSELPRLRTVLVPYYAELAQVADAILAAVACFYGHPPDYFASIRPGGDDVLRLLHYRADAGAAAPPGFGRHVDSSLVSLLPRATDPGLEIEVGPDVCVALYIPADALLVGVGAVLSQLTEGEIPALQHRVLGLVESGVQERYSATFFVNPRPDAEFTSLRMSTEGAGESSESRVTFDEYFRDGIRRAFEHGAYV
jgi:isopenicillin N synthase-like dioxygenase